MKKHIVVISQYFYPEEFRINDICIEWVKKGYEVTVVTGIPNYPKGKFYKGYNFFNKRAEKHHGINIIRLPIVPRGNGKISLALNYFSFVVSGYIWCKLTKIKADLVFIYEVSPMTQALPGVWYASKNKIPSYLYVTDLWPDNVEIVAGVKNTFILNSIGKMVDYIYKKCDRIFTSSQSFVEAIENRKIDKEKLEFWPQYAEDFYKKLDQEEVRVEEIPNDDFFNVIFAGNIGYAQGLEILPKVAEMIKNEGLKVRFNIVGDGRYKEVLKKIVLDKDLEKYFNFISKQPPQRISEFMAVSDATLITLAKNKVFAITIPAKTQSCLACGIPIIVSADGEIQDIINEAKAGVCGNAGDAKKLFENIKLMSKLSNDNLNEMGINAVNYYNEKFDKNKLLLKMDKWLLKSKSEL